MSWARNPQGKIMFGYCRVSTEEQAEKRNGLEVQRGPSTPGLSGVGGPWSTTPTQV